MRTHGIARRLVATLALVSLASVASATVLVPMSDDALVGSSHAIVLGTVARVDSRLRADGAIVSDATLAVERVLKGAVDGSAIVVTVPGGTIDGVVAYVSGAPRLAPGERLVVFLKQARDGGFRPNALALGAYRVVAAPGGQLLARRHDPSPDVRRLDAFMTRVEEIAGGMPAAEAEPDAASVPDPTSDGFTFLSNPTRWMAQPVTIGLANAAVDLGPDVTATVVLEAMQAWTSVPTANLVLALGAASGPRPSIASGVCDGASVIQFDDPFAEVQDMVGCAGVLAVGGFCGNGSSTTIGGTVFHGISEADITVNPRLGSCFGADNVAEVVTHELGHAIGLGHSTDPDATMYAYAHFDGRGASVHADDIAGVSAIYPASGTPTSSTTSSTARPTSTTSTSRPPTTTTTSTTSSTRAPTSTTTSTTAPPPSTSTTSTTPPTSTSTTSSTSSTTVSTSSTTSTTVVAADVDGDGVSDDVDQCRDTPAGDLVGADGCSVCPCDAPWPTRLDYLHCVRAELQARRDAGDLSFIDARDTYVHARDSTCGSPGTTRCCLPVDDGSGGRCVVVATGDCTAPEIDIGTGSCSPRPCGDTAN